MTKQEKRRIVREMLAGLKASLMEAVDKSPTEWNGVELRQLMADYATEKYTVKHSLDGSRMKDYRNARLNLNI